MSPCTQVPASQQVGGLHPATRASQPRRAATVVIDVDGGVDESASVASSGVAPNGVEQTHMGMNGMNGNMQQQANMQQMGMNGMNGNMQQVFGFPPMSGQLMQGMMQGMM